MDKEIQDFIDFWKEKDVKLPNPQNYPKSFEWYVTMWKYHTK
jgi:hypothetical protein